MRTSNAIEHSNRRFLLVQCTDRSTRRQFVWSMSKTINNHEPLRSLWVFHIDNMYENMYNYNISISFIALSPPTPTKHLPPIGRITVSSSARHMSCICGSAYRCFGRLADVLDGDAVWGQVQIEQLRQSLRRLLYFCQPAQRATESVIIVNRCEQKLDKT